MDLMMGAGAGANLIGGIMQAVAASRAAKEMKQEYLRELRRQTGYQTEAGKIWQGDVGQNTREYAQGQMEKGRGERTAAYARGGMMPFSFEGPTPTARDLAASEMSGGRRATLGSYADWGQQRGINNLRTGQDLYRVGNFARGTASVFPYRMYDAQHSMDELAFWGQLIASLGGTATNFAQLYGLGGGGGAMPAGQPLDYQQAAYG